MSPNRQDFDASSMKTQYKSEWAVAVLVPALALAKQAQQSRSPVNAATPTKRTAHKNTAAEVERNRQAQQRRIAKSRQASSTDGVLAIREVHRRRLCPSEPRRWLCLRSGRGCAWACVDRSPYRGPTQAKSGVVTKSIRISEHADAHTDPGLR